MQDFWGKMNGFDLPASNSQELDEFGFTIIPGPVPADDLARLVATYDALVSNAISDDVKVGSSTTRVRDFVNRGPEFDRFYLHPPILKACCHIIGRPFRLSTMHSRTVRPGLPAQDLHVDYARDSRVGRWWVSSSWSTSSDATTVRLDLCRAHTCGPTFHRFFLEIGTGRQTIRGKFWLADPRVRWLYSMAQFGMATQ